MTKAFIPDHLAHRPRHGGLPIPWVVADGKLGRVEFEPCAWPDARCDLMTVWRSENTTPDFAKYDEEKLRRCVYEKFCHICGRPNEYLMICVPRGINQTIRVGPFLCPLVKQPWVCAECLAYATMSCPPLKQAIAEGQGTVYTPTRYRLISTYYKPATDEDPVPPVGTTVLSLIKVAIEQSDQVSLPEWCDSSGRHIRKRLRMGGRHA